MLFLQILLKEYNFDNRHKPTFTEEDILNIFPVVKHVNPKASDAFHFFQSGQAKVQQGTEPACLCLLRLLLINTADKLLPATRSSLHMRGFSSSIRGYLLCMRR